MELTQKIPTAVWYVVFLLAACTGLPSPSLVSGFRRDMLSISPERPSVGQRVRFVCTFPPLDTEEMPPSVTIRLLHLSQRSKLAVQEVRCGDSSVVWSNSTTDDGRLMKPSSCWSLTLDGVTAEQSLQGLYDCDVSLRRQGRTHVYTSKTVYLEIAGDASPEVARLSVSDAATGAPIAPDSEVAAGTRLSGVCESAPASPPASVAVNVTGGGAPVTSLAPDGRLEFQATVPREPRVAIRCRVYNGFGRPQTEEIFLNSSYSPVPSEMTMLQEADADSGNEQILCSVKNNPPKRLIVTGLESGLLERDYPRFVELPGESSVFVKFAVGAGRSGGGRLVTFTCGVEGSQALLGALHIRGSGCDWEYWRC